MMKINVAKNVSLACRERGLLGRPFFAGSEDVFLTHRDTAKVGEIMFPQGVEGGNYSVGADPGDDMISATLAARMRSSCSAFLS